MKLSDLSSQDIVALEATVGKEVVQGALDMDAKHENHHCPSCDADMSQANRESFKDQVSFDEFNITGYCQPCQDIIFAPPAEDDDSKYPLSLGD